MEEVYQKSWISFTEDFHARISALQDMEKDLGGKRSGLFFEIIRLAEEIKPLFLFLENVPLSPQEEELKSLENDYRNGV